MADVTSSRCAPCHHDAEPWGSSIRPGASAAGPPLVIVHLAVGSQKSEIARTVGLLPPYESPRDSPLGHGAKRRRVMDAEQSGGDLSSPWMRQPLPQESVVQASYIEDDTALRYPEHVDELATAPAAGANEIISTGVKGAPPPLDQQQQQQQHQQWNHQHASHLSSYPEASLFQQPFFFQQTDPSIYNSPWPPTEAALAAYGNAAAPAGHYNTSHVAGGALLAGAMPFFPEQSDVEATTALGGAADFPQAYSNLYPTAYDCTESQARPDVRSSSSLYYEDASMHLKIQSLSILEDLVHLCMSIDRFHILTFPPGKTTHLHDRPVQLCATARCHARQGVGGSSSICHAEKPLRPDEKSLQPRNTFHRRRCHPVVSARPAGDHPPGQHRNLHLEHPGCARRQLLSSQRVFLGNVRPSRPSRAEVARSHLLGVENANVHISVDEQ
nr:hypothetical protein CFP56_12276 [Quercus suber]